MTAGRRLTYAGSGNMGPEECAVLKRTQCKAHFYRGDRQEYDRHVGRHAGERGLSSDGAERLLNRAGLGARDPQGHRLQIAQLGRTVQ